MQAKVGTGECLWRITLSGLPAGYPLPTIGDVTAFVGDMKLSINHPNMKLGGTFILEMAGYRSLSIPHDAPASLMQLLLEVSRTPMTC